MANITVVGAGLAGAEAAYQLCRRGHTVTLREMKPEKRSPAGIPSRSWSAPTPSGPTGWRTPWAFSRRSCGCWTP